MATVISVDGSRREVHPQNGMYFELDELRGLLGSGDRRLVCGPSRTEGLLLVLVDWKKGEAGVNSAASMAGAGGEWHHDRLAYGTALLGSDLEVSCLEAEGH
jgi:hypothetical protein